MKLIPATREHLRELMGWLPDARAALLWGGPKLRFPFTEETVLTDSRHAELPSFSLLGSDGELLGFGQYYERVGRCHLGRLIIGPQHRGRGLGPWLVGGLVEVGANALSACECSLFVLPDNMPAKRLYEKLGFVRTVYPGDGSDSEGFDYMIAPVEAFTAWRLGAGAVLPTSPVEPRRVPPRAN